MSTLAPRFRPDWRMFLTAVRDRLVGEAAGHLLKLGAAALCSAAGLVPEALHRLVALAAVVLAAGCSTAPANLDVALAKPSSAGIYRVALEPPPQPPAINQMH